MQFCQSKKITNGVRHQICLSKNLLSKNNRILKTLCLGAKKVNGRNLLGKITVYHKGGGAKQVYRLINFFNESQVSILIAILYDPFRNSFISLNYNLLFSFFFFNLSVENVFPGSFLKCSSSSFELKTGFRLTLLKIPTGSLINSLSLNMNEQVKYIRSAGTFGQLVQKNLYLSKIRLPSGKILTLSSLNYATIGIISNKKHNLAVLGKAGRNRFLGKRPIVRGVAMNPVDHPHGGRTKGGCVPVTPWGLPTRGVITKKKK